MNHIKCVIFDFDGTIANTARSIQHTATRFFDEIGIKADPDIIKANIGLTLRRFFALFYEFDDASFPQAQLRYDEIYRTESMDLVELFDGVLCTLAKFKERGIYVTIGSNNTQVALQRFTAQLGIDKYIDHIVCLDDVKNGKPEPDIALEIMRRCNVSPAETLVVGDSIYDVAMAVAANCPTCCVTYGAHSCEKLREAGCQTTIDSFVQLEEFVLGK